jgi:hypothetical protein
MEKMQKMRNIHHCLSFFIDSGVFFGTDGRHSRQSRRRELGRNSKMHGFFFDRQTRKDDVTLNKIFSVTTFVNFDKKWTCYLLEVLFIITTWYIKEIAKVFYAVAKK